MTVLLDTNFAQWTAAPAEFGPGVPIGQLITPLTGFRDYGASYAIDNGSYVRLDVKRFQAILRRQYPRRERCLWVAMPDVVGNARRTLELFEHWSLKLGCWPRALVCQNGQEDLPIPWDRIAGVFIGGDDTFKDSRAALDILKTAHGMGKHCHVGRVNGEARMTKLVQFAEETGIDISIDGSALSQYSERRIKFGRFIRREDDEQKLFQSEGEAA
jgi:hypothetical protein